MLPSRPILSKPDYRGSMGGMLMVLNVDPGKLCKSAPSEEVRQAITRCLACPTDDVCGRWLRDPERRKSAYHAFCPNADLFDRVRHG